MALFGAIGAGGLVRPCAGLFLAVSWMWIVLGGGVMKQQRLFPLIHRRTADLPAGYAVGAAAPADMTGRIVPPRCPEPSGLVGLPARRAGARRGG